MTNKLQAVYDASVDYYRTMGKPAGIRKLGDLAGVRSSGHIHKLVTTLVLLGLVSRVERRVVPVEIAEYLEKYQPKKIDVLKHGGRHEKRS